MLKDLLIKNRSYRRFDHGHPVNIETLKELIDLTRYTASAANRQNLRYILINEEQKNENVFQSLGWAGYLKDWDGPEPEERPTAYIVIVSKVDSKYIYTDLGIAAQTILLGAVEKGLGGCMFGSIDKRRMQKEFDLSSDLDIMLVIAIGKPREKIILEKADKENLYYWRDKEEAHHVPKLDLIDMIWNIFSGDV